MNEWRLLREEPSDRGGRGYVEKIIGVNDSIGFFSFSPAASRKNATSGDRCDDGVTWGPMSFHDVSSGSCNCGNIDVNASTQDLCTYGYAKLGTIAYAIPILTEPPVAYICYQECANPVVDDLFCRQHWNCNARTLQELFKLLYEWDDCYTLLGNTDNIAVVAHELIQVLEVPQEVEDWVRNEMPDGPVVRFLNGDPDARERSSSIPDLPDFFSRWLWYRLDDNYTFGEFNRKNL